MDTAEIHFKFINSKTGNCIHYQSLSAALGPEELKAELEKIRAQVAIKNAIYQGTVYWERVRDDE